MELTDEILEIIEANPHLHEIKIGRGTVWHCPPSSKFWTLFVSGGVWTSLLDRFLQRVFDLEADQIQYYRFFSPTGQCHPSPSPLIKHQLYLPPQANPFNLLWPDLAPQIVDLDGQKSHRSQFSFVDLIFVEWHERRPLPDNFMDGELVVEISGGRNSYWQPQTLTLAMSNAIPMVKQKTRQLLALPFMPNSNFVLRTRHDINTYMFNLLSWFGDRQHGRTNSPPPATVLRQEKSRVTITAKFTAFDTEHLCFCQIIAGPEPDFGEKHADSYISQFLCATD
jgi:hypothetical protein